MRRLKLAQATVSGVSKEFCHGGAAELRRPLLKPFSRLLVGLKAAVGCKDKPFQGTADQELRTRCPWFLAPGQRTITARGGGLPDCPSRYDCAIRSERVWTSFQREGTCDGNNLGVVKSAGEWSGVEEDLRTASCGPAGMALIRGAARQGPLLASFQRLS
jgi:hypothetical protein